MTSVNELNTKQSAYKEGKRDGYDIGYKTGHADGYSESMEWHMKEKRTLRLWRYAIAFVIGFMFAIATGAEAQTSVPTTVTVTISAEVACNPTNCPEIGAEEPVQVQNVAQEQTLLQRIWSAILKALT